MKNVGIINTKEGRIEANLFRGNFYKFAFWYLFG